MLTAVARALSAIQTPLAPAPSPSTLIPGVIVPATRRDRAPICVTVLSPMLATKTEPSLVTTSAGRTPTATWSMTRPSSGSRIATLFGPTCTTSPLACADQDDRDGRGGHEHERGGGERRAP